MGGTGDPPVPSGHWPDGREPPLTCLGRSKQTGRLSPFRAAGRRAAQAGRQCYPAALPPLISEFAGLKATTHVNLLSMV